MSWAALLLALFAPAPARAEPSARHDTLLLNVAAPPGEAERLEGVVRELLQRLGMRLEVRRVARIGMTELRRAPETGEPYFARVWIALAASGRARLYLEHGASDRLLVREIAGNASNPELVREELGHILQTAVEGLQAGEEVGAPRNDALKEVTADGDAGEAPREPAPDPAPAERGEPARREPARWLRFGPRYELSWLAGGARFEDGPGAVFALARPLGFELGAYYRRPLKVAGTPVGVRLQTLSVRGLVTLQVWHAGRASVRLGAGGGADFVRVSPSGDPGESVELSPGAWLKLAVARLQATYAHRAFSFMELELSAGMDLDVNDTRYVFQQGSGEQSVLEPWPVRPFVSLGATVP